MADALLSPAVGGGMWALSAGAIAAASARLRRKGDDRLPPLMGVLGGFLFAAQMINFSIPGTGSSGHLAGGLLLAVLLGPSAAFLAVASVLVVQAFFFADGGLLALGCNIFNMGLVPAFVVYPFVYRKLVGEVSGGRREALATMLSALLAVELGAFCVVLETAASGVSQLPVEKFLLLMLPIHLAIGLVEGMVTLAVVSFVRKARPELFAAAASPARRGALRPVLLGVCACALLVAGGLSHFASRNPDGLEWSVAKASAGAAATRQGVPSAFEALQARIAWFPEYALPGKNGAVGAADSGRAASGTGLSGVIGTLITLLAVAAAAFLLRKGRKGTAPEP